MADRAGEDANIHPLKTDDGSSFRLISRISRKAEVSGGSSGGVLLQDRAVISNVPKRTGWSIGTSRLETRAVILSSVPSTTARTACSSGAAASPGSFASMELSWAMAGKDRPAASNRGDAIFRREGNVMIRASLNRRWNWNLIC